jgi:8-oxo-dGTP pyrophosphatase MutT (NUDIX family)
MIQIAGGVVWNPSLGIAVVNQNNDSWSLPKGHVEAGETHIEAAIREIHEETGVPPSALAFVREVASYERGQIMHSAQDIMELRHITLYLFTTDWGILAPIDQANPEALWVKPVNVSTLLSHPIDKKEFERIITLGIFK